MAIPRSDDNDQSASPCDSWTSEEAGNRYFVPWSESVAQARLRCYACLLIIWRIDTQRETERLRLARLARRIRSSLR
jgi:hypothetical protein